MKKIDFRVLCVLLSLLIVFSFVACKEEVHPNSSTTPQKEKVELTTKYYMPAGWSSRITTPMWQSKDDDAVTISDQVVLNGDGKTEITNVTEGLKAALAEALRRDKEDPEGYFKNPKNIIIIISDGMGISHVRASERWSGELIMTQLPNIGVSKTLTREEDVTDSAAGGTALSTGYKTTKLFASVDAEGNNLKTVSELAREQGKLVGIVTNAQLEDATPADYSVHNKNRSQGWTKIAQQQVVFGADLFMGNDLGGYQKYFSSGSDMYKFVEKNKLKLYSTAKKLSENFSEEDCRLWAIFDATANKFARFDTMSTALPNLQQMTAYAISWLDAHADEEKGFIVMIENTYTDHFGHGNSPLDGSDNTYGIVKEVQSTDEAVAIALRYVLEHPDTALIVTADHETGNMSLRPGWEDNFENVRAISGNHSGQNVPVFAIGKGTEALNSLTEDDCAVGKKWYEAQAYENALIGQVVGHLLGDVGFGGDVDTDHSSKTSPKFEITVTEDTSSLTFSLDLTGVPVRSGDLVQFKLKSESPSDSLAVALKPSDGDAIQQLGKNPVVFSTTDSKEITIDEDGNKIIPSLMKAYKQAFIPESGSAGEGWYQYSVAATTGAPRIIITLNGAFSVGDKIYMDDLTIQYGSTIGELLFSSDNATATGECLVKLN